jgi:hypothetical protein
MVVLLAGKLYDRDIWIAPLGLLKQIALKQLLPLAVGMIIARLTPKSSRYLPTLNMLGNLIALGWFGMWMGMNSKSTSLATLKTIALVQVAPWFAVSFLSALVGPMLLLPSLMKGNSPNISTWFIWFPLITSAVAALLYLVKNLAFIFWARRKIYTDFRVCATRTAVPIRMAVPPPLLAPLPNLSGSG